MDEHVQQKALRVLEANKVAIFVVAYNAERQIGQVLRRIPEWITKRVAEIYVIDDHSQDQTLQTVSELEWSDQFAPLHVYRTPINQGYGGNQKLGYGYALSKNFDIVILLHGDGQYAPEAMPALLAAYDEGVDAVFGSRFIPVTAPLRGRMPLYKWIGNQILTFIQNRALGTHFSEMHSGYRSYRCQALRALPFLKNSNGFDFDADIIIQFVSAGFKIREVPIPTFYGDEICYVNGIQYAWNCLKSAIKFRLMQFEIFYDPKFDIPRSGSQYPYSVKASPRSLHSFIRNLQPEQEDILDVGGGGGFAISAHFAARGKDVTCIDLFSGETAPGVKHHAFDLDEPWETELLERQFSTVFALDVIEHLKTPESGVRELFERTCPHGTLYASTGNVAFLPIRLMLTLGQFNYGRRGILDLTHKRLFTVKSFRRLLENAGFSVLEIRGFGFPLTDISGKTGRFYKTLEKLLARLAKAWPSLFAFQILITATRRESHKELIAQTFEPPQVIFSKSTEESRPQVTL